MPPFLGICGVLEFFTGLMVLAAGQHIVGTLLVGFALLTFGLGAVIYELQLLRRQVKAPGSDPKKARLW